MHEGYLEFAGTEVINASRTRAYMKAFTPGLSLRTECCSCEDLAVALGDDEYGSPQQDGAPWFSPTNPATAGFYGLIPLGLQGFEDSTMATAVVENVQEGASFGRPRRASRPLRVSALAVAQSEASMDAGLAWLRDVLNDSGCVEGDCSGASLCWLADCPTLCGDPQDVILDLPFTAMGRVASLAAAASWRLDNSTLSWISGGEAYPAYLRVETSGQGGSVHIPLEGLTPGAIYRVEYTMGSDGQGPVSIPGMSSEYHIARYAGGGPNTWSTWLAGDMDVAPEVFEFTASDSFGEFKLDIPPGYYGAQIGGIRIRRVAAHSVRMQRYGMTTPATWVGEVDIRKASSIPTWDTWLGYSSAVVANADVKVESKTIPAFGFGMRFTVAGLTPGVPARVVLDGVWIAWDLLGSEGHGLTHRDSTLGVQIDGVSYANLAPSPSVIEFTPTAQSAEFFVGNRTDYTFRNATVRQTLRVELGLIRVEQFVGDNSENLSLGALRRTLGTTTTTSGPVVSGTYPERSAVIRKVEWEMVAGSPRPSGDPLVAVVDPRIPVVSTRDRECVNGAVVEENLFYNPSFEAGVAGWALGGSEIVHSVFTLTRAAVPDAVDGSYVMRLTYTGTATQSINTVQIRQTAAQVGGWNQGDVATFSFSARASRRNFYGRANVNFQFGEFLNSTYTSSAIPRLDTVNWTRVTARQNIPYGINGMQFIFDIYSPSSDDAGQDVWAPGDWVEFDAMRFARGSGTVYFDGDYPNASWEGLPDASVSRMVTPPISAIVDPDCPQPPAPPQPPVPETSCLDLTDTWRRRYVDVGPRLTQAAPALAPVLTLTSSLSAARSVRVRIFPNLFQRDVAELDPCSACGEFVVSYLPPNAVMTIDSVDRRVSVSMDGATQPADHLIYDSSGGPVIWPEMTCGVPYIIEIGVDSDSDAIVDLTADIVPLY